MTSPNPKTELAEALASGNPRRITAAVEQYVADQIYRATGKTARQPLVQRSTTLATYPD